VAFEIPLIIFFLTYIGVIEVPSLTGNTMRVLLVASAVIAALISPDPSGIGMMLILVPYYMLIVIAVALARFLKRRG
jgi:sec-independent protein translocase protein TatC